MQVEEFYGHGKLLLSGEYVVLDGAAAMALPCRLGQSLRVEKIDQPHFEWTSYLKNGELWQKSVFTLENIERLNFKNAFEKRLFEILRILQQLQPKLFESRYAFSTKLDFEKDWGLGSSSTLIYNLAKWAKVDAFLLLDLSFGGSGYDIAAASRKTPFIFRREGKSVFTEDTQISENIKPFLYFVYLNQKQNSREGILKYRSKAVNKDIISKISEITVSLKNVSNLDRFENLLQIHEDLIAKIIDLEPVQSEMFKDYTSGIVKSLGAWGGDFVLVTAKEKKHLDYFKKRGFRVIFSYEQLVF